MHLRAVARAFYAVGDLTPIPQTGWTLVYTDSLELSDFEVLEKRSSYTTESALTIFIKRDPSETIPGSISISPGEHVLRIRIDAWHFAGPTEKVVRRLAKDGDVWSNAIDSTPMSFEMDATLDAKCRK